MPEAEKPGVIFAYPVSDAELKLHELICDRVPEFDESGGELLWWRPMGPPSVAGPVYMALRSAELEERDRRHTEEYHSRCRDGGGERRYLQGEYHALARRLAIPDELRPAIVFLVDNSVGARVILPIAPAALEDMERRRQLTCFLYQELGAKRIGSFAGLGDAASPGISNFKGHIAAMGEVIAGDIAHGRGVSKKMWQTYCFSRGLIERADPKVCTIGEAELSDRGAIKLRTFTNGTLDGEVTFTALNPNVAKQRQLMFMLLSEWRGGVHLRTLVEAAYGIDIRNFADDQFAAGLYGKRMAQMIRDIRGKKLEKAGINPDVLPTLRSPHIKNGMLCLRLAKLTLHGFGHTDHRDRSTVRPGRRLSR